MQRPVSPSSQVVLTHPRPRPEDNSYIGRWSKALLSKAIDVQFLTVASALKNPDAVVHIHWPEHLISHDSPLGRLSKKLNTFTILSILTIRRRPVIWTAHNEQPHSVKLAGSQRLVLFWVRRLVTGVIVTAEPHIGLLTARFPDLAHTQFHIIPLGSLALESAGKHPPRSDRNLPPIFIQFGTIDPYKEQLRTLDLLESLVSKGLIRLQFVGRIGDADYADELRRRVAGLQGAELFDRYVSDAELCTLVRQAHASLALQTGALNSGVIPASVPLGTPVISADTAQARQARDSIGVEWIQCISERPTGAEWLGLIDWSQNERQVAPVEFFDWDRNVSLHLAAYEDSRRELAR